MKFSCLVPFLVVCVAVSALGITRAQSVLGECVDETLVLGAACQARPKQSNFFKLLENSINACSDTVLIVLELTITDVDPNVRNRYRFDLVKTDLGQALLTLKSQMEFLTINLPLLSDRVGRQRMELIPSPPGCLTNITITDAVVKNWLLCGLTKDQDGIEILLVKKVCFAKHYEEPGDWYLFRDTYYHECTETSIKDSDWVRLNEAPLVIWGKRFLNYGVTISTILSIIGLTVYRRLFQTKARLFLFKLQNPDTKICDVKASSENTEVSLFPNKINLNIKLELCYINKIASQQTQPDPSSENNENNSLLQKTDPVCQPCKIVCSAGRRVNRWKNMTKPNAYELNITGYWLDIETDSLISQDTFGLVSLLQASMEDIGATCMVCCSVSRPLKHLSLVLHIIFTLIVVVGVLVPVFLFYKYDPFHTFWDGIFSLLISGIVILSIVWTNLSLGFCCDERAYFAQLIFREATFFFLAYYVVVILTRVIVIILVGLAFNSESNIYTLISSAVLFVLANGYSQLKKTHKRYHVFLQLCIKHIRELVDKNDTLSEPVFKNRIIYSDQGNKTDEDPNNRELIVPVDPKDKILPQQNERKLVLTLKGFVLFYLPNGESAIDRDVFLKLCKDDISNSPGSLRCNIVIELSKFLFWAIFVTGILIVQHCVAEGFDRSLYSQAPSAVLGGVIPIVFDFVFFPEHPKEENANLTRLFNNAKNEFEKTYTITDFEFDCNDKAYDGEEQVWKSIYIEKTRFAGCCCIQGLLDKPATKGNKEDTTQEGATKGIANLNYNSGGDTSV